jgi:hypothetical protein
MQTLKITSASWSKRKLFIQIGCGVAATAVGGVLLFAQQQPPTTTIPGPVLINGPLTVTDGKALMSTEMNSAPMFTFVSSPNDPLGRKGRVSLYAGTALMSSNVHYDTAQSRWVADNPSATGVLATTQGDNFEVWQLAPGATDLIQGFGVYPNGIGMYTRQPRHQVDIREDVHVTGNLFVNGVLTNPYIYGGDNDFAKNFDLDWSQFPYGCHDESDEGDVYLTGRGFQLYGPAISFSDVPGVVYDDGAVKIENVRKTDHDNLSVAKYNDHVHYRVNLHACTGNGGAHRYIKIHVQGRKKS